MQNLFWKTQKTVVPDELRIYTWHCSFGSFLRDVMSAWKSTDLTVNMEKNKNALGKGKALQPIVGGPPRVQKAKFILQVSVSFQQKEPSTGVSPTPLLPRP